MGCIIYYTPSLAHCVFSHSEARGVTIYSHLRGAFSVARFDLSGNAKAFLSWNEQQDWLHAFYLYKSRTTKNFKRILWEPLCKDFTRMKRNLKRKWLLLLFVVTGVFGLTACSDDYEPWELLTAEMTSTLPEQPNLVPWDGGTFTINVKTNGAWDMVVPDWMTVDQNKGFGDAVVNASITQNESSTRRTGDISIKFIGDTKASVAGSYAKGISFLQEALYEAVKINISKAELYEKQSHYDNYYRRWYYDYGYRIEYEIESTLSEDEINSIIEGLTLKIYYVIPHGSSDTYSYKLEAADITKGKHVIENLNWKTDSYSIHPNYTEAYFGFYSDGKYKKTQSTRVEIIDNK